MEPKFLKLTKQDDKIYSSFRETFKDLDIKLLKEDDLKSDEAKEVGDTVAYKLNSVIERLSSVKSQKPCVHISKIRNGRV